MAKKRKTTKRKTTKRTTTKRTTTKRTTTKRTTKRTTGSRSIMPKKSKRQRVRRGLGKVFKGSTMTKVVAGIGAGVIGGVLLNQFAPQWSGIGKLGAAFLAGGPVGAISSVALDQFTGQGSILSGMFGGGSRNEVQGL